MNLILPVVKAVYSRCYYCVKIYWVTEETKDNHFCSKECQEASENEVDFKHGNSNIPKHRNTVEIDVKHEIPFFDVGYI